MKLDHAFQRRCERITVEQRDRLGLKRYAPMPADQLAASHNVVIIDIAQLDGVPKFIVNDLLKSRLDGVLVTRVAECLPMILLRPRLPSTRRQSTIMHEMAHLLLDHEPLYLDTAVGQIAARNQRIEDEAAHLGGCLQISEVALQWAKQTGLSVPQAAKHFGASEAMVRYRSQILRIRLYHR